MGARWSSTTKRVVVAIFALAALYIVYRAGDIVRPFVWAGVLAFVLLPLVGALERRLSLPRTAAAAIVFLGLLAAIIGGAGCSFRLPSTKCATCNARCRRLL